MGSLDPEKLGKERLGIARRKALNVSPESLTRAECLRPGQLLPLVVRPAIEGVGLTAWAVQNREFIETSLLKHGGILFRDFGIDTATKFEQFVTAISGEQPLEYRDRSSPRHEVGNRIYTSTDYPDDQSIFLHNEGTYWLTWPQKIFFCCMQAPEQGGETLIGSCRRIFQRIAPEIRQRFIEKKVLYVRNYNDGFGLPWQTVFQTTDKATVENYCRQSGIELEWKDKERLRTRQVRPAVRRHPRTGEIIWFNHAAFFHVSTLEPTIRDTLLATFAEEDLPFNTYYGDGSEIEPWVLDELREAFRQETVTFPWQHGDVLMLDNMLSAHGRAPYTGSRKVLVAMTQPVSNGEA